jgi:hypothetical protein
MEDKVQILDGDCQGLDREVDFIQMEKGLETQSKEGLNIYKGTAAYAQCF